MVEAKGQGLFARVFGVLRLTLDKFSDIDGTHRAAAFSYYAFFSLFPLMILLVTVGSKFVDHELAAARVIGYVENRVPLDIGMKRDLFDTLTGVVDARKRVSVFALVVVVWGASQFLEAIVRAVNRAWGTDMSGWWRLPVESLMSVAIMVSALFLSMIIPIGAQVLQQKFPPSEFASWTFQASMSAIPTLVMLGALGLFYKLAPRRPTRFAEIWLAAISATLLLRGLESLFVVYLKIMAGFNAVYGVFGGLMAMLMWVYISGCIVILGACLSSAQAEARSQREAPAKV